MAAVFRIVENTYSKILAEDTVKTNLHRAMAQQASNCLGHQVRENRKNKISLLAASSKKAPDENCKALINKGPVSVETSLKELEEHFESKSGWKKIEDGGVLVIPVEELRMENPPQPNRSGQVVFSEKKNRNQIDNYPIIQTVHNMNGLIRNKYEEEKEKAKSAGKSTFEAEKTAFVEARKLPQFLAVKSWQDIDAEIKLKRTLERMMVRLRIPALLIRSLNLKQISALNEMGLKVPEDAEIDLIMAYVSGDILHVVVFEVKRRDTYPWQAQSRPPNKQAINKAESQLTKDLDILMAILAGIPPKQINLHALACYPDTSVSELQTLICQDCLENGVIYQEDLNDSSLLQKKTKVPDQPNLATTNGKRHLLTFTARGLSHHSLLHNGYREVADREHLVTERHKYNIQTVDGKIKQNEFVVASPQQQQVIADFTVNSSQRHLVLTGAAGTGKTMTAMQVVNNLIRSLEAIAQPGEGPVLLVTTESFPSREDPLLRHLDANTMTATTKILNSWMEIMTEYGVIDPNQEPDQLLFQLTKALAKRWEGRSIVVMLDEITNDKQLNRLAVNHDKIPQGVTLILVANPRITSLPSLPESFLGVNLITPYRSTIAITSLAQFIAECNGNGVSKGEIGSDVEGTKPIVFDVGSDEVKLREALKRFQDLFGKQATLLIDSFLPTSIEEICKGHGKQMGTAWECYNATEFFGWEAAKVVTVTAGEGFSMEMFTRAKTHLAVILVHGRDKNTKRWYAKYQDYFQRAADQGLVELWFSTQSSITTANKLMMLAAIFALALAIVVLNYPILWREYEYGDYFTPRPPP